MDVLRHRRCRLLPFPAILDLIQELIQIRNNPCGIPVRLFAVSDLLQLAGNKVLHLQHVLHQLQMRHIIRMGFPKVIKDILQLMGNSGNVVKHHDAGGSLDGMHGSEYLVDTVLVEAVRILLLQNSFLKLLQKLLVLKQVYVQHAVRAKFFSHILLLSACYMRSSFFIACSNLS